MLGLLVDGKSDRENTVALFICGRTASKHVSAVLVKLDVASCGKAVVFAFKHVLI